MHLRSLPMYWKIYMQEFWVTVSRHHSLLCLKLNGKSHTVNVENFRDMLKICPKFPGQIFEEPPLEEEILSCIRDLGHTGEIKFLFDVNVNHMHQPWRSFAAIINKCLSGKTTVLESLRLSRAQILWGMYHNKTVDYVYLLWEDLVYQVQNKNSKKTMASMTMMMKMVIKRMSVEKQNQITTKMILFTQTCPHTKQMTRKKKNKKKKQMMMMTYEEDEELYGDLNLNLDRRDAEMTDAQTNQETKEVHVTLTTKPPIVQQQSSFFLSDLVSKFINPSLDIGIDSILNPNVQSDIPVNVSVSTTTKTPSSDTIIPQPPIPIIQSQQQTHDSITTTIPTTTLPEIPNFASLFGFERRVSSLETELSELKQTNKFAEALSSIPGIVDNYLASQIKDAVNVAVQLKSNKLKEEAQAENDEFLK
ncbi:hypothetical protein Tco_1445204 [Tanacetum coccineum]